MKEICKKFIVIWTIICTLLPTLFSGIAYAADDIVLTRERAGNFAANFAINFYENWSAISVEQGGSSSSGSNNVGFIWPLTDAETYISSPFGEERTDGPHKGLDIAVNGDKSRDIELFAVCDGKILAADTGHLEGNKGVNGGMGNYVTLQHNDITIRYLHLEEVSSEIINNIGGEITVGTYLGKMGNTGDSTGKHLHIDFFVNQEEAAKKYTAETGSYITKTASYYLNPEIFISEDNKVSSTSSNSTILRGEVKTEYDEAIDPRAEVLPDADTYKFNNISWIEFVYRNSLFKDTTKGNSNTVLTGSGDSITINSKIFNDKNNIETVKPDAEISDVIDISKLTSQGKILPGDILYIQYEDPQTKQTVGEYVLYVGGTKIIYATGNEAVAPSGALKYEYLQYYLQRIKRKLLEGHEDDKDYVMPKYGVTQVYRLNDSIQIFESEANLFFAGKGYYSPYTNYEGMPTETKYAGWSDGFDIGKWLFDMLKGLIELLISVVIFALKAPVLGWVNIIENLIQSVVLGISGNNEPSGFVEAVFGTNATSASGNRVTVESIFFNQIPILDVNFFDFTQAGGKSLLIETNSVGQGAAGAGVNVIEQQLNQSGAATSGATFEVVDENNIVYQLRKNLATWYVILRNLSIALLLFVLLYLGIRLAITSSSEKKAEYKQLLLSWVTSFILVIIIHLFMYAVINLNDRLVLTLKNLGEQQASTIVNEIPEEQSLYDAVRTKAYSFDLREGGIGTILYIFLVYMLIKFIYIYFKRFLTVYILVLSGTLMVVKHAFEKISGKKTTSLNKWIKDFSFNVLLQTVHALLYVLFMAIALRVSETSLAGFAVCLVILNFMLKADKIIINIFGLNKAGSLADVNKPEPLSKVFKNTMSKVLIGKHLYDGTKNILFGKRGLVSQIKYSTTGKDTYKDAEKELLKRKYERIGNRWRAIDKVLGSEYIKDLPIRKLFKYIDSKKILGNGISSDENKAILERIKQVKKLKKQRYTRSLKFVKNTTTGLMGMVAAVGVAIDSPLVGYTMFSASRRKIKQYTDANKNVSKYSKIKISKDKRKLDLLVSQNKYNNALDAYANNQYVYEQEKQRLLDMYNNETDPTLQARYLDQISALDEDRRFEEAKEMQTVQEAYEEMLLAEKQYKEADSGMFGKVTATFATVTGAKFYADIAKGENYLAEEERKKIFKEGDKLKSLTELAKMEEELGVLAKELKEYAQQNNLTDEQSQKMMNKQFYDVVIESRKQHIKATDIRRAVKEYMFEKDVDRITDNDVGEILEKLQQTLDNRIRHSNLSLEEKARLKKELHLSTEMKAKIKEEMKESMIKDEKGLGYNTKDATTNIQIILGKNGIIETNSTDNITDPNLKRIYDDILQKIKEINTYNEVSKIKNKTSLVDIQKILKNIRKM